MNELNDGFDNRTEKSSIFGSDDTLRAGYFQPLFHQSIINTEIASPSPGKSRRVLQTSLNDSQDTSHKILYC